jgi:hypothetical protein
MMRRMLLTVSVFALVVGSSGLVHAQAKPKGPLVKLDATITKVLPAQGILATGKDGKQYAIGFDQSSRVALSGNASTDFITPGTYVQMDVDMDGEGKPAKPVSKVAIVQQGKFSEPGVMSTKGPDAKPGEPGLYLVRGTVKTNKNEELTINAGSKQVVVKMALGATVPVNITTWQMAKEGDALAGDGVVVTAAAGNAPALVYGERIEIKAAMPITKPSNKK